MHLLQPLMIELAATDRSHRRRVPRGAIVIAVEVIKGNLPITMTT